MKKSSTKKSANTGEEAFNAKLSNGNTIVKKMDIAIKKHAFPKKRIALPEFSDDFKIELEVLFQDELSEVFWSEKMLGTLLIGLIKRVKSEVLSQALEENLEMSKDHVDKLTRVFEQFDLKIPSRKVEIVDYTFRSAKRTFEKGKNKKLDEIRIHFSLRKLRYYRLASYSLLMALALEMNQDEIVDIIEDLERREWRANDLLTKILLLNSDSGEAQKVYSSIMKKNSKVKELPSKKRRLN